MTKHLLFGVALGGALCVAAADFVWWEGESAVAHNFNNFEWRGDRLQKRHGLSGGDWLTQNGSRGAEEIFARYEISAPADGQYFFWARKFWKHGPFRWRFDDGEWQVCGPDVALADSFEFQTHIVANWVSLGKVKLTKGPHRFELRLLAQAGENSTACFDAFLLTPRFFEPRGKLKPGEKSGLAEPGWWAVEPDADPFAKIALLDLRSLNEKEAGRSGFVRADGSQFRLGNGKPVKFWGVNAGPDIVRMSREQVDYLAARLAKNGVNLVRFHGAIFDRDARDPKTVDAKFLGDLFYFVTAMKNQGIYTTLSFYFPLWFDIQPHYGIAGYDRTENKKPFALLYFEPQMQEIYKAWLKTLLTEKNPHTGRALGQEPAVASVELVNEDSYFFWTFSANNIPEPQLAKLEKKFGDWLAQKYGSVAGALAAWPNEKHPRDHAASGRVGLYDAWHMTRDGSRAGGPDKRKRMSDQVQFLAENQRAFYAQMVAFIRNDLGAKNLVSASNWTTADETTLGALERYTYTATDVIDFHGYFEGKHEGEGASYSIRTGHTFADRAAVLDPAGPPLAWIQYEGHPHIISEIGWTPPNRYRADLPFLCSAYGALQGMDGYYFFALNSAGWSGTLPKFPVNTPSVLGQFPAAALQYRRGDVKEAPTLIHQVLDLEDLFALKGSGVLEPQKLDALRAADVPAGGAASGVAVSSIDPLALFVGRVTRSFGKDRSPAVLTDLTPFLDRGRKIIRSVTGELTWDYGRGLVTVNTPRSQGATGFLSRAGRIELDDAAIESQNKYGTIHIISLDDAPLSQSRKILIQAFTEEQPYGWRVDQKGKLLDVGQPPMNVKNIEAVVRLKSRGKAKVSGLDEHGYAQRRVEIEAKDGQISILLPADKLYTIVQR